MKLLLAQSQELSKQKETITALNTQGESSDEALKRLKSKLDEKDAQIERLKRKLDEKDRVIVSLGGRPGADAAKDTAGVDAADAIGSQSGLEAECQMLRVKTRDQEELIGHMLQFLREKEETIERLRQRRPVGTETIPAERIPPRMGEFLRETAAMLESFRAQVSEKEAQLSALPYEDGREE